MDNQTLPKIKPLPTFDDVVDDCSKTFNDKLDLYGPSIFYLRPHAINDILLYKSVKIRKSEPDIYDLNNESKEVWQEIANYASVGLVVMSKGAADPIGKIKESEYTSLRAKILQECRDMQFAKMAEYGETWRAMDIRSFVDIVIAKIKRNANMIERVKGSYFSPEQESCITDNFTDIFNYAILAILHLSGSKTSYREDVS